MIFKRYSGFQIYILYYFQEVLMVLFWESFLLQEVVIFDFILLYLVLVQFKYIDVFLL